ncbi:MAG: TolC family protein [Deltaproteobacteria bacterium]|nr:TolC family protein [Deltaproteobacteria bacterium]MDQ3297585.1 TolC family protein [Myxococcota bacterium]
MFGPVDREVERRIGVEVAWHGASGGRVGGAVDELLAKPLDRDAVIRVALAMNRRLQAQYDELGIAASVVADATVLAPTELDVEYKRALNGDGTELEIEATQDILDLIQIPQRRGIANAQLAAARSRAVAATVSLVARVEAVYVDVVAAHQELELRQTSFDAASAAAVLTERMAEAGNVPELTLARERDQREQARIDLGRAQVDVEVRREMLNELLGVSGKQTRWTVAARLPDLPATSPALDTLERDAVAASLDLQALRADEEAAASRVGVARLRSWVPELGIGIAASRSDGEWEVGPAISVGLPIFNQQQGPRARAHAELGRARNEASATATELRARARATRQRVLEAYAEARHLRDVVLPLRQRIVDETLKQYNAMNASTFELLVARRDLVDAGRQYIDASRRYWRADTDARALARGASAIGADEMRTSTSRSSSQEGH